MSQILRTSALLAAVSGCSLLGIRWDVAWENWYGDEWVPYDMVVTLEGETIIVGTASSGSPGTCHDVLLMRLDAGGDTLWTRQYVWPYDDWARSVRQVPAGGFIVAGDRPHYAFLLRTDENGDTLWTRTFGDTGSWYTCNSAIPTGDGGFALTGDFFRRGTPDSAFLIRTDVTGNILWRRNRIHSGSGWEHAHSLLEMPDRGFIIAGSPTTLVRIDADGDTLWTRCWGENVLITSLAPAPDGGFVGAGGEWRPCGPFGSYDAAVWRFGPDGDTLWTRRYRDDSTQFAQQVVVAADGGSVVFGTLGTLIEGGDKSNVLLLKYDADGRLKWAHTCGSDRSNGMAGAQAPDGWFIVAGTDEPAGRPARLYIAKTRP